MSLIQKIQNWPNKKKKSFAIIVAIALTLVIVLFWHWFDLTHNDDQPAYTPNPLSLFGGMFSDIENEFHTASGEFASTTAYIKTAIASSSSAEATISTSTIATSSGK